MVAGKDNIKIGNYVLILEANKSVSDSKPCFCTVTSKSCFIKYPLSALRPYSYSVLILIIPEMWAAVNQLRIAIVLFQMAWTSQSISTDFEQPILPTAVTVDTLSIWINICAVWTSGHSISN